MEQGTSSLNKFPEITQIDRDTPKLHDSQPILSQQSALTPLLSVDFASSPPPPSRKSRLDQRSIGEQHLIQVIIESQWATVISQTCKEVLWRIAAAFCRRVRGTPCPARSRKDSLGTFTMSTFDHDPSLPDIVFVSFNEEALLRDLGLLPDRCSARCLSCAAREFL